MFDLTETRPETGERVLTKPASLLLAVALGVTFWVILGMVGAWVKAHGSRFLLGLR